MSDVGESVDADAEEDVDVLFAQWLEVCWRVWAGHHRVVRDRAEILLART